MSIETLCRCTDIPLGFCSFHTLAHITSYTCNPHVMVSIKNDGKNNCSFEDCGLLAASYCGCGEAPVILCAPHIALHIKLGEDTKHPIKPLCYKVTSREEEEIDKTQRFLSEYYNIYKDLKIREMNQLMSSLLNEVNENCIGKIGKTCENYSNLLSELKNTIQSIQVDLSEMKLHGISNLLEEGGLLQKFLELKRGNTQLSFEICVETIQQNWSPADSTLHLELLMLSHSVGMSWILQSKWNSHKLDISPYIEPFQQLNSPGLYAKLLQIIYHSVICPAIAPASSNSLSLLHCLNYPFAGVSFNRIRAPRSSLRSADFSRCSFEYADLSNSILSGADFSDSTLFSADLSYSDIQGTSFHNANLCDCKLSHTLFKDTDIASSLPFNFYFEHSKNSLAFSSAASLPKDSILSSVPLPQRLLVTAGYRPPLTSIAFSNDGKWLATGSPDTLVKLWSNHDGALIAVLEGHTATVQQVTFSSNSQLIGSVGSNGVVLVRSLSDRKILRIFLTNDGKALNLSFSKENAFVAVDDAECSVSVHAISSGERVSSLLGHSGPVLATVFSSEEGLLATASEDRSVKLWDFRAGSLLRTLNSHFSPVTSVDFSPDGQLLASGSTDGTVNLWRVSGPQLCTAHQYYRSVHSVLFSLDGQFLASSGTDNSVKVTALHNN